MQAKMKLSNFIMLDGKNLPAQRVILNPKIGGFQKTGYRKMISLSQK
tara:strand:- start:139 stop:279 length:141 start_codon:yes stop_codon:yes gene_type:complete